MRNIRRTLVMLVLISIIIQSLIAQKAPIRFGKVDISELEMKQYDLDTSAPAVILCDYGRFDPNTLDFTRIIRIKILKKEGYYWGNRVFPISAKTNIKGITFNLEDGKIVKSKLKSSSIYRERITEDYFRMRVAMPNVKEGSVIDISFWHPLIPIEWRFQDVIPVKYSELRLDPHPALKFRKNFFGYEPLKTTSSYRWIATDMPAFKEEPFINSINNYITKFEFDILEINIPGIYMAFTTTWEAVNKMLLESTYFGDAISGSLYLNSTAKEIKDKYETDEEKLIAAYEAIKKIKWNEKERLYTSKTNLIEVYKEETGNSADINLMLLQLLKKLDIEVYPVALSTRENGILNPFYPSLNKLNYVIVYARINTKEYLLDATEELMPVSLLPKRCLNFEGIIVEYDKSEWIDLKTDKKHKEIIFYEMALQDENTLKGAIQYTGYDYAAFYYRKDFKNYNSVDEYLESYSEDKAGLDIEDFTQQAIDSIYKPVKAEYDVSIRNQITQINDLLYINPLFYEQLKNNLFINNIRNYPVDFAYPRENIYILRLTLPDNYSVHKLPSSLNIKMPNNAASFIYSITSLNNNIQLTCKMEINKTIILNNEYAYLQEFYNQIINKHAEPIVIKKN